MEDSNKWDGVLLSMLQERQNYDMFFDYMFSFLRRKTDFFQNMKQAETTIANAGKKHITEYMKEKQEKDSKEAEQKKRDAEKAALRQQKIAEAQKKAQEEAEKKAQIKTESGDAPADGKKDEDVPPPPGNGAILEKYTWTQTLHEVNVDLWLPQGFNKKELSVEIESDTIFIGLKGQTPILNSSWPEEINSDESYWTIEDDENGIKYLHILITKWKTKEGWWKHIAKGEPEIDTSKINPESSKLSDLDPEMRGQVSKMMFDMRQKQKGEPSSDELQKQEKLKEFMKAHPEMDFSKAKFM